MKIKIEKDTFLAFFLSATIWFTPLRTFVIEVGNILYPGIGIWISRSMIICFAAYSFLLFVFFQWFRSFIFHTEYVNEYVNILGKYIFKCVPYYLVARNLTNWKLVRKYLYKSGTVCILLMGGLTLIKSIKGEIFIGTETYSMFYGLLIGKGIIIKCIEFIDTKRYQLLPFILISMVLMILYGTRTPIVCVIISILLCFTVYIIDFIRHRKIFFKRNCWKLMLIFIILCFAGVFFIEKVRNQKMNTIAPGERILYAISNGEFFQSKGRMSIYIAAGKVILNHSILGLGLIGDRIAITETLGISMEKFTGYYAHNLFLELILQNGIIIGAVFSILVIAACFHGLLIISDKDKRWVYVYLIGYGIGSLMFTDTIIGVVEFWIFLSIGMEYIKIRPFENRFRE